MTVVPPPHFLQPLLAPKSIALVGASPVQGSFSANIRAALHRGGFPGPVYGVNPKYDAIDGARCYESILQVPEAADLAILAVSNERIEAVLTECIDRHVRAAVIFASCHLAEDRSPPLLSRIRAIAQEAGLPICGANCLGFYNFEENVHVCAYARQSFEAGPVALVAHSGSVFGALVHNGRRLNFNVAVSSGQEMTTTAADYVDYALSKSSTRAVGLFLETVRDPDKFVSVLSRAQHRDVPVVILKVGRTPESAAFAMSHTGALAGDGKAFDAICERHGAIQVRTLDEMAATLMLLSHAKRAAVGTGIAAIHDSGGEREMVVDLATDLGVPFSRIGARTRDRLARTLAPGLDPVNPLDAYGTGNNFVDEFATCFETLMDDSDVALGVFFADIRSDSDASRGYAQACLRAARTTGKPVAMATNYAAVDHDELALMLHRGGVPVLDGTVPALLAAKHALEFRDRLLGAFEAPPDSPDRATVRHWRERISTGVPIGEAEGFRLLAAYGLTTPRVVHAASVEDAVAGGRAIGYPVVLKTATPGILHKTDVGGVALDIRSDQDLDAAYRRMADRFGSQVLIEALVPDGVELAFGAFRDPQFGPVAMIAAGGLLIEVLRDARYAVPPFGESIATRCLERLAINRLLDGFRGSEKADRRAVAQAFSRFSRLVADLGDLLDQVDVNPVRVLGDQCMALDALFVPKCATDAGGAVRDGIS